MERAQGLAVSGSEVWGLWGCGSSSVYRLQVCRGEGDGFRVQEVGLLGCGHHQVVVGVRQSSPELNCRTRIRKQVLTSVRDLDEAKPE